jgi:hypothetical protein
MSTNVKIIKKLGEGYEGDVLLIEKNNKPMIKKIARMPCEQTKPDNSYSFWREISFAQFAKSRPDYFMQLVEYGIDYQCEYKKQVPALLRERNDKKDIEKWREYQKTDCCYYLIYEPVLEGQLKDIYDKLNKQFPSRYNYESRLFPKEFYRIGFCLLFQQLYILYELLDNNWVHRDAHSANWMYKSVKSVNLGKYKLKCPYKLMLCDYGSITHKDYPLSDHEKKEKYSFMEDRYEDIILNIMNNIAMPIFTTLIARKKFITKKLLWGKELYDRIKKLPEASNIKFKKITPASKDLRNDINVNIFLSLFVLKYPTIYYEKMGIEVDKFKKYIIHYSEWEINIYTYLFNNIENRSKLLNYLYKLSNL